MVTIPQGLNDVLEMGSDLYNRLSSNPVATAIGGAVAGGAIVGTAISAASSSKKKRRSVSRKSSKKARRRKSGKRKNYKYARTAGKRRDKSTRRIRMTKNGQPYVILKSGKARFISKRSAHASRKRKGGRY